MNPDNKQPYLAEPVHAAAVNGPVPSDPIQTCSSVGALLGLGREKAGLSLGDVASRLRMGLKQVRALEQDDYSALPKGTFLRGFVRNFAKEVGVKPEQALELLEKTHHAAVAIKASAVVMPSQQNIKVPTPGGEVAKPRSRVLSAFAFVLILLVVVWWWWENVRPHNANRGRVKPVVEEKSVSVAVAVPEPTFDGATSNSVTPGSDPGRQTLSQTEPPKSAPNPEPAVVSAITPSASSPQVQLAPVSADGLRLANNDSLGLTFSDKSWVQVIDATGTTIVDRIFTRGEAENLAGRAPFSVVIGNAQATRLAYKGKDIDLAPHTRGAVARVTVK